MHELTVQLEVLPHHSRMNRVDLDDVIPIIHPISRRQFLRWNVRDERHGDLPGGWDGSPLPALPGRALAPRAPRDGRSFPSVSFSLRVQLLDHATQMRGLGAGQLRHGRFPAFWRWTMVAIRAIGSRSTQIDGRDVQFPRHIAQRDTTNELARSLNEVHAISES
jgi:hypothetical protein